MTGVPAAVPLRLVMMGVAGAGKTTVGEALAQRLGAAFLDADAAHPPANVEKMAGGEPLDDADRAPWLEALQAALAASDRVVITCSALKRRYRDVLRRAGGVRFVHLHLDPAAAEERVSARPGHFMKSGMVASQFDALEELQPDETDVLVVDARRPVAELVDEVAAAFSDR